MSIFSRLSKLEAAAGMGKAYPYMLVINNLFWKDDPDRAKGYKIQPFIQSAGGTGEKYFYLATVQDVDDFRRRADVELNIIVFGDLKPEESAALGEGIRTIEPEEE
jgi:hypothetical protein